MTRRAYWFLCCMAAGLWLSAAANAGVIFSNVAREESFFQGLAEQSPTAHEELLSAAQSFRRRAWDESLAAFREARKKDPQLSPAEVLLARLLLATGEIPTARQLLEQAAARHPEDPEAHLVFGQLALAENRVTDAALQFAHARTSIDAAAKLPARSQARLRGQALDGLAAVAEARGDWGAAEKHLRGWLALAPKNVPALERLGIVQFRLDRLSEAEASLRQAEQLEKSGEPAALVLARLHHQQGSAAKALEWIERLLAERHDNARAQLAAVPLLLQLGELDRAGTAVASAEKLESADSEIPRMKGMVARSRGDLETARKCLEEASLKSPADTAVSNQLALVLIDVDDKEARRRAVELAELNSRQFPKSGELLATLGWAYYRNARLDDADRMFAAAAQTGALSSEAGYHWARVMADRGQRDNAQRVLRAAVAQRDWFVHREDAEKLLAKLDAEAGGARPADASVGK